MDLFGTGLVEVLVVLVVAMLVLGPEQLPETARKLGGILQQARKAVSETRDSVLQDLTLDGDALGLAQGKQGTAPEQHGHQAVGHQPVDHRPA